MLKRLVQLSCIVLFMSLHPALAMPYPYPFEACMPSKSSDGSVCVQNYIAGAVSGGQEFVDYGKCEVVRSQRPYWFVPPKGGDDPNDPRLQNPEFKKDYDWVVAQIRSVGCSCCHTAKSGVKSTKWDLDAPGVFLDQLSTFGLAVFAGENVDFHRLSRFDPKDNYGFDMSKTAVPTQDPQRFKAFIMQEIQRRGITQEELQSLRRFPGGVFDVVKNQATTACEAGFGVRTDGSLYWGEAEARYVYIMRQGTENPLGPPSLHLPEGTIWNIRMIASATPLTSGVGYGDRPMGAKQEFPAFNQRPAFLEQGQTYKLYVAKDFLKPAVNCEFVFGVN